MGLRSYAALGTLVLVAAAGCASSKSSEQPTTESSSPMHQHGAGQGMEGMCPMDVPGTTVAASDVEGGAALSFTTTDPGSVDALRQRVQRIAAMHNQRHAQGGEMMPAATASAQDIPNGAQVVIRPEDPSQLETLRERVRMHAQRMNTEGCPHGGMHHSHPGGEGGSGGGEGGNGGEFK